MANSKDMTPVQRRSLAELTSGFRGIVLYLFLISGLINILALTGSLYMMQIYDRALTSGSIPTLVMLSVLDGFVDRIRGRMAGTDGYLAKPFQPAALVRLVREFCPTGSD